MSSGQASSGGSPARTSISDPLEFDGDEKHTLPFEPENSSALVKPQKGDIFKVVPFDQLLQDMTQVGTFINVAYHGVNAAGAKFCHLQSEVFQLQCEIGGLCRNSVSTMSNFIDAAQSATENLKTTYQHLLDGYETIAREKYQSLASIAKDMADDAQKLKQDFINQEKRVESIHKMIQEKKGEKEFEKIEISGKIAHDQRCYHKQRGVAKRHYKQAENSRKKKETFEIKEQEEEAKSSASITFLANLFTENFFPSSFKTVSGFFTDSRKKSADLAERHRQRAKEKEDDEKEHKKFASDALQMAADHFSKVNDLESDLATVTFAADMLHEAIGGIRKLITAVESAEHFWKRIEKYCKELMTTPANHHLQRVEEMEPDERKKYWQSKGFQMDFWLYHNQWVFIQSISEEYTRKLTITTQDLNRYVAENPSYDDSKKYLQQLHDNYKGNESSTKRRATD